MGLWEATSRLNPTAALTAFSRPVAKGYGNGARRRPTCHKVREGLFLKYKKYTQEDFRNTALSTEGQ